MRRRVLVGLLAAGLLGAMLGARLEVRWRPPPPAQSKSPNLAELSQDFVTVAEQVQPAVVSIDAVKVVSGHQALVDPFFPFMDEGIFQAQRVPSVGSGLVVRPDGYVVTNCHVVEGVEQIQVTFSNDKVRPAKVMGVDPGSDLALVKVDGKDLPTVPWGDSHALKVGEFVLAFGSPYRMRGSMTHGIVSAKGRKDLGLSDLEDFVQTDAAINPGNSGGPLVNLAGQVVGINSAILSKTGASTGISLAIPSEVVRPVIDELIAHGRVIRSWLGLFVQPVDEGVAQQLRLPEMAGALVAGGYSDGPGGKAGFLAGDVILGFDGVKVKSDRQLRSLVAQAPLGKKIDFTVWREARVIQLQATTEARGLDSHSQPVRGI